MKLIVPILLVTFLASCGVSAYTAMAAHGGKRFDGLKSRPNAVGNAKRDAEMRSRSETPCSQLAAPCTDSGRYVLAKTSTATSQVRVSTGRYESNLRNIMSWLPERWDLIAVLKWSAYGNDISILGPVAAKEAPALGVLSNEDASALIPFGPKSIWRIGPTSYQLAKDALIKGLHIQEFIGSLAELEAVTRVAKEHGSVIGVSIYLFDHYGEPWGFEFTTSQELQHLVDSIDHRFVKVRGIFTHLGYLSDGPIAPLTEQVQRFLKVACPVATKIAASSAPDEPPIMVHWAASSELSRLWEPKSEKLVIPPDLRDLVNECMSHPKVRFGIRVGSATYGSAKDLPHLQPVLSWTSTISQLKRTDSTTVAVVNIGTDDGYPRFFKQEGKWGEVYIGGKRYALATSPKRKRIEVDVGKVYDGKTVFVGADVCLLCDNLSVDDLRWVAADPYNISMCATGAGTHFAEATLFTYREKFPLCTGPVVIVPDEENDK